MLIYNRHIRHAAAGSGFSRPAIQSRERKPPDVWPEPISEE